ncbi:MAG TPA: DUF948 domain-containing protein [Streptosporangiaceae bacterium]|jgi:uncharacterized protein YoxC
MNAGQLAALIAAGFFALGVCVAVFALFKLARLTTEATRYLSGMRERTDTLIEQAHAAIDRTNAELDRTEIITANMDQVTANVAELTGHVNALANVARAVAAGPVGKAGAVAFGVRRAVSLRRRGDDITRTGITPTGPIPAPRLEQQAARRPELEAAPAAASPATQVRRTVVAWTIGRVSR